MADAGLSPDLSSYSGFQNTNRLLATATNTPQAASDWLDVARKGQALNGEQFQQAQQHLQALNTIAASVMADPTVENATARIGQGVLMGVIKPEDANREFDALHQLGGDPTKIKQWGFQHAQTISSVSEMMQSAYGTPGTVDNGPTITPVVTRTGPQAGVYAAGGNPMQKYMTPSESSAPQSYPDPVTGRTIYSTMRGYGQAVGDTAGLPPAQAAPAPAPGYSGANSPNSYVDPQRAGAAGVSIVNGRPVYGAAAQPSGPVGGRAGTNSRGAANPQATVPGLAGPSPMLPGGIEDYRADLNNSSAKMQAVQPLITALPLIEQLGSTGSGPGTKAFNDAKSALVSAGIVPTDATDVDIRDEANKYLKQYVAKSGIAQRSDMGTLVSQESSPNLDTSNKATIALTRNSIAQDRMEAARPLAYSNSDLSGYGQHKAGWTQSQDPRAYQLDLMPADQRAALLTDMAAKKGTPQGRKFFSSLQKAMDAKVVTAPNVGGASGQ